MYISNIEKAKISYDHKDKIQRLFKKYVNNELYINHFSLNVFFGDGQSIFLSPTPEMAEELCKHDFVSDDSNYDPEIYKNLKLYPWRSVQRHEADKVINFIKEEKFGMRSGNMIVRDLGDGRYIMYSFATHKRDNSDFPGQFNYLYHCKANYIAQMGDFLYDNLLPVINQYANKTGVEMPKLNNFAPIELESNLYSNEQRDILHTINERTNTNVLKVIENKRGVSLWLINGGRVQTL